MAGNRLESRGRESQLYKLINKALFILLDHMAHSPPVKKARRDSESYPEIFKAHELSRAHKEDRHSV